MAITYRSEDKYAFLFTGPTAVGRFIKDLENVFLVLTEYYNYPAGNIHVVLGSASAAPNVPGATVININDAGEFRVALESFSGMASGPATGPELPPGVWHTTALLYFTGGGVTESSVSKLVIDDGPGTANVDPAWLTARLNTFSDCHVNVVAQQSFAGGFQTALAGSALSQWSFSYACSDSQDSYGNNTLGSFFSHGWLAGLKLETLPAGTPDAGSYADQLGSAGDATNRLVSHEEAADFGKQVHDSMGFGALSTPGYSEAGGAQYPGLPDFLIRDSAAPNWWESPDIYLTHPNHGYLPQGDLYIPDLVGATPPYNNTINVDVRNVGTHPARAYSLGVELFKSGLGAINEQHSACDKVPGAAVLLPIDQIDIGTPADIKDTYEWNSAFTTGTTHECIKAEAKLLCGDVDFAWSIVANNFEGQRNTDEMTIVPPPPPPVPFPMIQGIKEHVYGIQNRFDGARRFLIAFPKGYQQYQDAIELQWFGKLNGPQAERNPIDVVYEPVPHIPLILKADEKVDIILQARIKDGFTSDKDITLPFEILAQGEWADGTRLTTLAADLPNYAAFGGFTVTIKQGSSTLKGAVIDREGTPVAKATVAIRTVNDLQGAVITTDDKGGYILADINPDVYFVHAETENLHSVEQTIVLQSGKEEALELKLTEQAPVTGKHVKVILDKIRVMNDKDPCIKGKGELTFNAVVIPDNDHSRKHAVRLPGRGVYHVSDKPGQNEIRLEATLFEGIVKNRSLSISISGKEIDCFDPDDALNRYHRVFSGDPDTWCGQYYPSDEYLDREDVGDWALWYRVESK